MDGQPRIVYRTEVKPAQAVLVSDGTLTIIVVDPDLSWAEQEALIKELLEDTDGPGAAVPAPVQSA